MVKEFRLILFPAVISLLRFALYASDNGKEFLVEDNLRVLACHGGEVGMLSYINSDFNVNCQPHWRLPKQAREWLILYQYKVYCEEKLDINKYYKL